MSVSPIKGIPVFNAGVQSLHKEPPQPQPPSSPFSFSPSHHGTERGWGAQAARLSQILHPSHVGTRVGGGGMCKSDEAAEVHVCVSQCERVSL